MKHIYLLPGTIFIPKPGEEVSTNLGSCVSVVLCDPMTQIAGLTHYVLPFPNERQTPTQRFGSVAITDLLSLMEEAGAKLSRIQAHVYGGGNIFRGLNLTKDIGEQNIAVAFHILTRKGIPIVHQDVGGVQARKITLSVSPFKVVAEATTPDSASDLDLSGFGAKAPPSEITVAIVDDNENIRELFKKIFAQNGLKVVGTAGDAHQARKLIVETKPMVVTLDIEMPGMTGVEFLKKLMEHFPTPVVMVSQLDAYGEEALQSMEYGAVEFVQKPLNFDQTSLRAMAQSLVEKVRAAAFHIVAAERPSASIAEEATKVAHTANLLVVGGNIGSPEFLQALLESATPNCPPIVVADSTIGYFLGHYLRRVEANCSIGLHIAGPDQVLQHGNAYFISKPYNGTIELDNGRPVLRLGDDSSISRQPPSINMLFSSAAKALGKDVTAILLSSFGADGLAGLESISSSGGQILLQHPKETKFSQTIQQALELGLFDTILAAREMIPYLSRFPRKKVA
ncbi:MAG: response regulator [Bdellovibrionales bacterium]|nr:response regulator [Bdellovibrionales bacterium]